MFKAEERNVVNLAVVGIHGKLAGAGWDEFVCNGSVLRVGNSKNSDVE